MQESKTSCTEEIQRAVAEMGAENKQLRATINSMRGKIEADGLKYEEDLQKLNVVKENEHKHLQDTVTLLREQLEESHGSQN